MKSQLRTALLMAFLIGGIPTAQAQDALGIAGNVPTEVSEVVSGGNWSRGDARGFFRAIAITKQTGDTTQAAVVVQLLAVDKAGAAPKVTKTVLIKEVAEKKLSSAFLAMNAETDNELTLIITSYDQEKDQETALQLNLDSGGKYEIVTSATEEPALTDGGAAEEK